MSEKHKIIAVDAQNGLTYVGRRVSINKSEIRLCGFAVQSTDRLMEKRMYDEDNYLGRIRELYEEQSTSDKKIILRLNRSQVVSFLETLVKIE